MRVLHPILLLAAIVPATLVPVSAKAQSKLDTAIMTATISLQNTCVVATSGALDFGTQNATVGSNITEVVATTARISASCTLGLDPVLTSTSGNGFKLISNSDSSKSLSYNQVNIIALTRSGSNGSYTWAGRYRLPAQTLPAAGTYTDTISYTITF